MKYNLKETINAAMMNRELLIIVEGQDDIKFYSKIAQENSIDADVKAVELIDGYTEGCEKVIEALSDANKLFEKDSRLKRHVMGVIDRDSREYRNTLPSLTNLLVLKYYSYETHLINDKSIINTLKLLTKVSPDMITPKVLDYIKKQFEDSNGELYYFSLEALKHSCMLNYNASITYDDNYGKITDKGKEYYSNIISFKKDALEIFATEKGITKCDIKKITKGKWYLGIWCDFLIHFSKTLYKKCGVEIPKCCYCESGKTEKCLWRKKASYNVPQLEAYLMDSTLPRNEVSYIVEFMNSIKSDSNGKENYSESRRMIV